MASKNSYSELLAFVEIAREGSFTRAAAKMGISTSALSHAIRALETRLEVRLLTRTTRSVSTTEAGERLYQRIAPHFDEIDLGLEAVREQREKPAGTVRITTAEHAANSIIWPKLAKILPLYPDITVEVSVNFARTDIAAERFDAGVRLGDELDKDMIAVRIGPDQRIAVVGSPEYFAKHPKPTTPYQLTEHNCINLRLPTHGGLLPWVFDDKDRREFKVKVSGQWIYNSVSPIVRAALAGQGLAYVPEDTILEHIKAGRLVRTLDEWCIPYTGYHLYYPSRKQASGAFPIIVEALRHKE
ncbi:LysR family transcriptional regulator [Gilvimarinus japonicus]|uniref:LysR family transcriptional regulator n=1 Tax=Gilvimarinus japonicus TaxID=1796469 RepID=A0ABV7HTT6_9GAMM